MTAVDADDTRAVATDRSGTDAPGVGRHRDAAASTPAPARRAPVNDLVLDVAVVVVLVVLAMTGFRTVFAGWSWAVVGAVAMVVATAGALLARRFRLGASVTALVAVGGFLVAGSITQPDTALAGIVPTPESVIALVQGVTGTWKHIVTSVPPMDPTGEVLVAPYLVAYAATFLGLSALRVRRPVWLPVLAPTAALVATIALGTDEAAAALAQGVAFGGLALWWTARRAARTQVVVIGTNGRRRAVQGAALVLGSLLVAALVGPHLPGLAPERDVVRDHVDPPFDPRAYPSPLVGFRRYNFTLKDDPILHVTGAPKDTTVRLAVLDDYDGLVWNVADDGTGSGRFERVGSAAPFGSSGASSAVDGAGTSATVTIQVDVDTVPWLPLAGEVRSIEWQGPRATTLRDDLRVNRETKVGAQPSGLRQGDTYELDTVFGAADGGPLVDADPRAQGVPVEAFVAQSTDAEIPQAWRARAASVVSGAATPYEQVVKLREWLRNTGYYTDGTGEVGQFIPAGHSINRLSQMLDENVEYAMVGDDEQYAALATALARSLGLPARVAMGFAVPNGGGVVTGKDVRAWTEVNFAGLGWVPFAVTPNHDRIPQKQRKKTSEEKHNAFTPPPPLAFQPPESIPDRDPNTKPDVNKPKDEASVLGSLPLGVILAVGAITSPLWLLAAFAGGVVWLKHRRRLRRRTRGAPAQRIAGGWREVLDLGRDLGYTPPTRSTRRESTEALASALALDGIPAGRVGDAGRDADAATFGPATPDDAAVERYWSNVDALRSEIRSDLTRRQRWRAAVRTSSLRARWSTR